MSKNEEKKDVVTPTLLFLGKAVSFTITVLVHGIIRKGTWTKNAFKFWCVWLVWSILIVFAPRWNFPILVDVLIPNYLPQPGVWIYRYMGKPTQLGVLFIGAFLGWLFFRGIVIWMERLNFQKGIDHLGLKTSTGLSAEVKKIVDLDPGKRKVVVQAIGIDIEKFKERKGSLESSFNSIVQDIRVSHTSRQMYEIYISDKELPTLVRFDECSDLLSRPYTFLVGQTMDTFIVADLCEIHHMLIAGATGGGKSFFFKQCLIGLLKSSEHLQLYLIDLKRGVEAKPFEVLNNVEIAKNEMAALAILENVVREMERRFVLLEEKGFTEINPERDKLDRIVVAIDEASVLFTVEKSSKSTKAIAQNARELTDKIAKLGRAAGVHVILATQKVVKETIDTRVQTNINAKMCFRVNTLASSMTVLGNKKAAELPDVKGRGIWSVGSNDLILQVPRLNSEEVTEEISALTDKFNREKSPLKQAMLTEATEVKEKNKGLVEKEDALEQSEASTTT